MDSILFVTIDELNLNVWLCLLYRKSRLVDYETYGSKAR